MSTYSEVVLMVVDAVVSLTSLLLLSFDMGCVNAVVFWMLVILFNYAPIDMLLSPAGPFDSIDAATLAARVYREQLM
ncbi:unnamed protein product [Amaranthus hypochondriacus]